MHAPAGLGLACKRRRRRWMPRNEKNSDITRSHMQENTNTQLLVHQYKCSYWTKGHRLWVSDTRFTEKTDKICYFPDRCLQASTQTACPCEKPEFIFHARVAPVKTRRYFKLSLQICWGRVLFTTPLSVCRATLNMLKSLQYVLADGTGLTHVSLCLCQLLTLRTGEGMNHFKRCPGRQKVNCLSRCSSPTSWEKKKSQREETLASAVPPLTTLCN